MRKVCLIPLFGNYDTLKDPGFISEGWEYFVVTDKHPGTELIKPIYPLFADELDDKRKSSFVKTQPHRFVSADIYITMDASIEHSIDFNAIQFNYDIKLLCSTVRDCFYDEALTNIQYKKDDPVIICKQIQAYFDEEYPLHSGMVGCGFMIRKNTSRMREFGQLWFSEMLKYSKREQLSFNYIKWKNWDMINYELFEPEFWNFIKIHNHNK